MNSSANLKQPSGWVFSSFASMTLGFFVIWGLSYRLLSGLGLSADELQIHTNRLALVVPFRWLLSPFVEMFWSKRFFVVACQWLLASAFAALGLALNLSAPLETCLALLWFGALVASVLSVATDGLYVTTLSATNQAKFIGVQHVAWAVAWHAADWMLPSMASAEPVASFAAPVFVLGGAVAIGAIYHGWSLPVDSRVVGQPRGVRARLGFLSDTFVTFFRKNSLWSLLACIGLFGLAGGVAQQVGWHYLTEQSLFPASGWGIGSRLAGVVGAVLGGRFVAERGLSRTLLRLCVTAQMSCLFILFVVLAEIQSEGLIGLLFAIAQFFFWFGMVGQALLLMRCVAPGRYQTAHFSFGLASIYLLRLAFEQISAALGDSLSVLANTWLLSAVGAGAMLIAWRLPLDSIEATAQRTAAMETVDVDTETPTARTTVRLALGAVAGLTVCFAWAWLFGGVTAWLDWLAGKLVGISGPGI